MPLPRKKRNEIVKIVRKVGDRTITTQPFRSVIPAEVWADIYAWYTTGVSRSEILRRLNDNREDTKLTDRTLTRLLSHLQKESSAVVAATMSKYAERSSENALKMLDHFTTQLAEMAETNYKKDDILYLKTIDRLKPFIGMHVAINESQSAAAAASTSSSTTDELLDGLIAKLGTADPAAPQADEHITNTTLPNDLSN
jgi:hypothetical protein